MALMMEPGRTEPLNEEEDADMAAIEAIRESAVTELKVVLAPQSQFLAAVISWSPEIEATRLGSLNMEHIVIRDSVGAGFGRTPPFLIMGVHGNLHGSESGGCYGTESFREFGEFVVVFDQGNDFVKKGKKHYKDAIDCYTRAINQKTKDASMNSILYGNRAQVNLLLGNYRRAIDDADEAVKLNPSNVKAFYRGAKAALSLGLWPKVAELCSEGLNVEPANKELQSMKKQVEEKQAAAAESKRRALEIKSKAEALVLALEKRKLRLGQSKYRQHTGLRRPSLDRSANAYKRDRIELYYQTHVGPVLSKKQLLTSLMEDSGERRWVKVQERTTLHEVIAQPKHIIPGIPVFYVVATGTSFREKFLKEWSPP
ncbi:hypothetical protein AXG93_4225s1410 [Marchantia polymorpha subsp. ruderalis]|uniref:Uncharacterized protein n=1 Tax=Marchantia polymorpha subsp. ruderalis TaxID=1480154 RepID=A0A176WRT5_MARPO|nr:hypothetical protein AXG93_4225s1410 [Marchantia polymorpha subsp. ruderalis]